MQKLIISLFVFGFICIAPSNSQIQNRPMLPQHTVENTAVETVVNTGDDTINQESEEERIEKLNEEMGLGEQKSIVIEDIEISPNDNKELTKSVVPNTKSELRKMIYMFLKVMASVAISSIIIFILLLLVKKFYTPKVTAEDINTDLRSDSALETPQNKTQALKTFLDKTRE